MQTTDAICIYNETFEILLKRWALFEFGIVTEMVIV
jgi:hypothetical protein